MAALPEHCEDVKKVTRLKFGLVSSATGLNCLLIPTHDVTYSFLLTPKTATMLREAKE
jgi:hypothetical protein